MRNMKKEEKEGEDDPLRADAEEELSQSPIGSPAMTGKTVDEINHELRVNQIELKIQNEELMKAYQEIEASRDRYINLYDFAPVGYFTLTSEALITEVNLTGAAMLGVVRKKLNNARFRRFISPKEHEGWDHFFQAVLNQGEKQTCELKLKRKEGNEFFARIEGVRIDIGSGSFQVNISMSDVTERKQAEEILKKNEEVFRLLYEHSMDAILLTSPDGRILTANPAACTMFGRTEDEMISGGRDDIIDITDPRILPALEERARTGKFEGELTLLRKEGTRFPSEVSSNIFADRNGLVWTSMIIRDITERKRGEEYLIKLNALKEGLLGSQNLEHKLNQITRSVVEIFGADFARIWVVKESDLCDKGCIHNIVTDSPDICRNRNHCLHLVASSGRYSDINGEHRRVPLGFCKIGRVANGAHSQFITNNVTTDPQVHDHAWAKSLGLVSFAGFRLLSREGNPTGVLALFRKTPILPNEVRFLEDLASTTSHILITGESERALSENEAKFRTLFESATDAIFIMNSTVFLDCNHSTELMYGCTRDTIIGHSPAEFSPERQPDGRLSIEKAKEKIDAALSGKSQFFEWVHTHYDRTPFDAEVSLNRFAINGNNLLQASVRDITKRKQADELLKKTTHLLNDTQAITKLGGWEFDVASKQVSWTDEVYRIYGVGHDFDPSDAARNIGFYAPDDTPIIDHAFSRAIQEGEPYDLELKLVRADGRIIWVRTIGNPIMKDGQVVRVTGNIMDITERKQMEISLREALQKLRLLSGLTRHDILNQVCTVQLLIDLTMETTDPSKIQEYISRAQVACNLIETTIGFTREYEDFGNVSSGWQQIYPIIESAKTEVTLDGVTIQNHIPRNLEVYADPIIRKVFTTLMDNAIRHGENITNIRISCSEGKDTLIIICEDDGGGIPSEEKEYIFDHGYGKHTGIGLFLAREILSITGLSIRECGEPGKGARFEITAQVGKFRRRDEESG